MKLFVIALTLFVLLAIGIVVTVRRVKKGKEKRVREYYSFQSVSMLIGLGGTAITAIASSYSAWDFLADFFQIRESEPVVVTLISRFFVLIIFCVCAFCVWQVCRTYKNWDGPVSERQYWQNVKDLEAGNLLLDFLAVLKDWLEQRDGPHLKLQVHQSLEEETIYGESDITRELPWHIEFAQMYMLLSNQAVIDIQKDWHSQEHCYISPYAGEHWIGLYCCASPPDRKDAERFLSYIHRIHPRYLRIVIAVEEGEYDDDTVQMGEVSVEYIFKENALKHLADFTGYYKAVDQLYHRPLMESSSLTIEDIYVEPVCQLEKDGSTHSLQDYVQQWLQEDSRRQLALFGDFGQGKTLFSIRLTYQMIQKRSDRIPILIFLRNKSPRNSTSREILSYFGVQYGIRAEALQILNRNGKLLLIFDGFDEMDLVGNDDIRKLHFRSLWSLAVPKAKIFITGRPSYFLSPDEMRSALGMETMTRALPYCEGLHLQLFSHKQILQALRSTKESVRTGIQRVLEEKVSKSFQDLIRRPSLLFYVGQMWEERELEKKYHNLSSAVIIHEFLQHCFERQAAKGSEKPFYFLSPPEREYFMIGVAVKMYKVGEMSIEREEFQNTISQLIDLFPDRLSRNNPVYIQLRNGKSVREFAGEDRNCRIAIINDVRSCGVLVHDYANNGLTFAHKSFYDLLVAQYFVGKELRLHDEAMEISDTLSKVSAYNPRLKGDYVVRKLLAELISAQIAVRMKGTNARQASRKIFERCVKAFFPVPFGIKPDKLLYSCRRGQPMEFSRLYGRKKSNEVGRFKILFFMAPMAVLVYLIKLIQLNLQLGGEADQYYNLLIETAKQPQSLPEGAATRGAGVLLLILAVLFCILGWLREQMRENYRRRADLTLFTWFCACMDHHIPLDTVLQIFPKSARNEFLSYIRETGAFPENLE